MPRSSRPLTSRSVIACSSTLGSSGTLNGNWARIALVSSWKERARDIKTNIAALGYACRDPRVPWYAKVLAACVVAYALSPIDLIPDAIPVLGYLDDLVLLPVGIVFVVRMIPPQVLAECRDKARTCVQRPPWGRWVVTVLVVGVWLAVALACARWVWRRIVP